MPCLTRDVLVYGRRVRLYSDDDGRSWASEKRHLATFRERVAVALAGAAPQDDDRDRRARQQAARMAAKKGRKRQESRWSTHSRS